MRVTAWMCDRCSRMQPGESKPIDWIEVSTQIIGQRDSKEEGLFCSDKCAGLWFRSRREETVEAEGLPSDESVNSAVYEDYQCPQCDWHPGKRRTGGKSGPIAHPDQSLRMHIHRAHGKIQGSPGKREKESA